jgi:hypothetical protein
VEPAPILLPEEQDDEKSLGDHDVELDISDDEEPTPAPGSAVNPNLDATISNTDAQEALALEGRHSAETAMVLDIRQGVGVSSSVVLLVHSAENKDVFVYLSRPEDTEVQCSKIPAYQPDVAATGMTELSGEDALSQHYEQVQVDNSERDYPLIMEMVMPEFVFAGQPPSVAEGLPAMGQIVGGIYLPFMKNIIFDIWKVPGGPAWATTTVDGINFAVIERIFIKTFDPVKEAVEVDIFGRHPKLNLLHHEVYLE